MFFAICWYKGYRDGSDMDFALDSAAPLLEMQPTEIGFPERGEGTDGRTPAAGPVWRGAGSQRLLGGII